MELRRDKAEVQEVGRPEQREAARAEDKQALLGEVLEEEPEEQAGRHTAVTIAGILTAMPAF